MTSRLDVATFRSALDAALTILRARRAAIDAANVYPVPDGDTGTNLVLTFEAVAAALAKVPDDPDQVVKAVRTGSLMGARGNSGVIMAQILRGLTDAIEGGTPDVVRVADAFKKATELAYDSVLEPAEGTILSVQRAASEAAQGAHADVASLFAAAARAAGEALRRTPSQLPALARAGVVDAGGMGLVAVLEAFEAALAGRAVDEAPAVPGDAAVCEGPSPTFALEVQYMLDAPDETITALRQLLGTIGDSVAVVGGDGRWRVHVHTDDRDRAVGFGEAIGRVADVEVVAFADQIAALAAERPAPTVPDADRVVVPQTLAAAASPGERGITVARAARAASLIAVASGAGVQRMFRELGAIVVDGGRTMNPSVGELLEAIERAPMDDVVVLPNNENVFAAATAAVEGSGRRVTVLRSGDMAEGLAASIAYGDARSHDETLAEMQAALDHVRTGQVVVAVRDADTPAGYVEAGRALGFAEGAILLLEPDQPGDQGDPVAVATAVVRELLAAGGSVVTVLCGDGVGDEERARLRTALEPLVGAATLEVHEGGQPVHRYLIAVE